MGAPQGASGKSLPYEDNEVELLRRAQAGDRAAINRVFRRYIKTAKRACNEWAGRKDFYGHLGLKFEAESAASTALEKAIDTFDPARVASFETWIYWQAKGVITDLQRKAQRANNNWDDRRADFYYTHADLIPEGGTRKSPEIAAEDDDGETAAPPTVGVKRTVSTASPKPPKWENHGGRMVRVAERWSEVKGEDEVDDDGDRVADVTAAFRPDAQGDWGTPPLEEPKRHPRGRPLAADEFTVKTKVIPIGAHTLTRGEKGRVIRVEFVTFEDFFAELGPRPGDWCIADRRNRAGNWSPGNVRWVRDNHPPKRHNWKPPGSRGDEKLYRPQTSAKLQQQLRERRVFARIVELRGPEFLAWVFEKEDINSVEKRDRQIARGLWIDTRSVDNKPWAADPHFVRLCEAHGWDPRRFGNAQRHFTQAEVARLIEKDRKTVSRVRKRVIKRWTGMSEKQLLDVPAILEQERWEPLTTKRPGDYRIIAIRDHLAIEGIKNGRIKYGRPLEVVQRQESTDARAAHFGSRYNLVEGPFVAAAVNAASPPLQPLEGELKMSKMFHLKET